MASRGFEIAFNLAAKLDNTFKSATSGAAERLQKVQSRIRDLGQGQQRIEKFQHLKRQLEDTRSEYESTQDEVKRLAQEIEASERPTKAQRDAFEQAKRKSQQLKRSLDKQENQLQDLRDEMREAGQSTQNLAEQHQELGRQIQRAQKKAQGWQKVMGSGLSQNVQNLGTNLTNLGRRATIAGGIVAGGIFGIANSTASLGDQAAKTADNLGLEIGRLQELRYAAERSGISTQTLDKNMERFVKRTGEAAQGTGRAKQAYEALGMSAQKMAKLSPDEALTRVAERLQNVDSQQQRVAHTAAIFGREGVSMVNMLSEGSEGLRKLAKDARETGYVLGDEAARDAEKFKDAMLNTKLSLAGLKNMVGAELMPVITKYMKRTTQWLKENRDMVEQLAQKVGKKLGQAVPVMYNIAQGAAKAAQALGKIISTTASLIGGYDKLAIVAAAAFSAKVLASMGATVKSLYSIGKGLAMVITNYTGSATAAQGAAAANTQYTLSQKLLSKSSWTAAATLVKQKVATIALATYQRTVSAATKIWAGAQWALNAAMYANPIGLIIAGAAALGGIAYYVITRWNKVKSFFTGLWEWISNIDLLGGIKKAILTASPVGWLLRAFKPAINWLSNLSFVQAGKDLIGTMISGIMSKAGDLVKKAKEALGPLGKLIPGSDAEEGPLSKLTKAGQAIPKTMAKGVQQAGPQLQQTVSRAMGVAAPVPTGGPAPAMAGGPAMNAVQPSTSGGPGGGPVTLYVTNNISLDGSGEPETEIRRAGDEAAKQTKREVEGYFAERMRLGYH